MSRGPLRYHPCPASPLGSVTAALEAAIFGTLSNHWQSLQQNPLISEGVWADQLWLGSKLALDTQIGQIMLSVQRRALQSSALYPGICTIQYGSMCRVLRIHRIGCSEDMVMVGEEYLRRLTSAVRFLAPTLGPFATDGHSAPIDRFLSISPPTGQRSQSSGKLHLTWMYMSMCGP